MEKDEDTFDTEEELQDGELDFESLDEDESESGDKSKDEEPSELTEAQKLEKAQAEANKWRRLAQKNGLGTAKPQKPAEPNTKAAPSVDVDERILKSQGMPDDLLKELKGIAKIRGVSLIDAQADFLFVAAKEKYEKDKKIRDAQVGASRGSGTSKPKADLSTPGLSRDAHRELFNKRVQ